MTDATRSPLESVQIPRGPWRIAGTNAIGMLVIRAADGRPVAAACDDAYAPILSAAQEMLAALEHVRAIIVEGAATGFNPHDGDWAERLFASQAVTFAAVKKAGGKTRTDAPSQ